MKIIRYTSQDETCHGILHEDETVHRLARSPLESLETDGTILPLSQVRVRSPLEAPRVIGVGLNYAKHAAESGQPTPSFPMLFMKPSTGVIGPEEAIVYPTEGEEVHYECELAVVIGKSARRVSKAQALDYVLGYTCGNDVSERTIQFAEMKTGVMLMGKGFDTFCPLGPCISTDLDPTRVDLSTRLNGETKQAANTSDLIFSVADLIAYISRAMTLLPGDVILTGTPEGIGPMRPGDTVEIEVEGVGTLRNPVVAEPDRT
jgi:2-keto-4-pentenoate hydratase/2-oxohepta-3-ene-1,7-dioic acid hydratase in catechol pathway